MYSKFGGRSERILSGSAVWLMLSLIFFLPVMSAGSTARAADPERVGSQICLDCHAEVVEQFRFSVHARLAEFELFGEHSGCEACHGPGGDHVESLDPADLISFRDYSREAEETCQRCHSRGIGMNWMASEHGLNSVSCSQCHQIHQSRQVLPEEEGVIERPLGFQDLGRGAPPRRASLRKPELQLCAECHRPVTARMMLPSRHPVPEGKMTCSDCHEVHGGLTGGMLKSDGRSNDLCVNCHASKQGPFVFEHEPVSESCQTCHSPHGTMADNLLRQNEPFLCLQCHEAHFHIGRVGLTQPNFVPSGGSMNPFGESGWRVAFGTKCTQCHRAIHGTDLPSQTVAGQGRALVR